MSSKEEGNASFQLKFTNSKIFFPGRHFNHFKEYLWFRNVHVESRDRVSYMSLLHGKFS